MVPAQDDESAQMPCTKGLETIEDELTIPRQIEKPMRRHKSLRRHTTMWFLHMACNKTFNVLLLLHYKLLFCPLLINVIMVIVTDYACSDDDWFVIENIKSEPSKERHLVSIDDAFVYDIF